MSRKEIDFPSQDVINIKSFKRDNNKMEKEKPEQKHKCKLMRRG